MEQWETCVHLKAWKQTVIFSMIHSEAPLLLVEVRFHLRNDSSSSNQTTDEGRTSTLLSVRHRQETSPHAADITGTAPKMWYVMGRVFQS